MFRFHASARAGAKKTVLKLEYFFGGEESMRAKDVMTADPACCISETTLQEVAQMMIDHDCGEIPVVENKENKLPIGVITDRDIVCRAVARGLNPLDLAVGDYMSKPCMTVTPDLSV